MVLSRRGVLFTLSAASPSRPQRELPVCWMICALAPSRFASAPMRPSHLSSKPLPTAQKPASTSTW